MRKIGRRRRRGMFFLFVVTALVLLTIMLFVKLERAMNPMVRRLATSEAHKISSAFINESVNCILKDQSVTYDDLMLIDKNAIGDITAMRVNMQKANLLMTEISMEITRRLNELEETELSLPLGTLFSSDFLVGRGIKIPVRLHPFGNTGTELFTNFSAAGVNQTRHQILIRVKMNLHILLPFSTIESTVEVDFIIAETVVVGHIPDFYAGTTT